MFRRIAVVVLVVLGLLVGMVGNLSGWTWWFLADTDNFVDTVAPLSEEESVATALATKVVDQIWTEFDVDQRIEDAFPDRISFAATPVSAAAKQFAFEAAFNVIQSEQFNTLWRNSLTKTHDEALGILRGEDKIVEATNGRVNLDLQQIFDSINERLQQRGIDILANVDLPPNLGVITLFESGQIDTAQNAVEFLDNVQFWFPILALVLLGAAIALARDRRKTLFRIGIAIAAVMLLELLLMRLARNWLLDKVKPENQDAFTDAWNQLLGQLRVGLWALVVFGIVVAIAAALLAPEGRGAQARAFFTKRIHDWREGTLSEGTQDTLGRVLAPWKRAIQFFLVVIVLAILVALPSVRPRAVLLAALLLVILLGLVEFVAGRSLPAVEEKPEVEAPTT